VTLICHNPPTPHLILGGARSGKSAYAEELLSPLDPPYIYLATAQALDDEMRERVRLHRERRSTGWETVECPVELPGTLRRLRRGARPILIDCLTLWVTNLLLGPDPDAASEAVKSLCLDLCSPGAPVILVSNEVGTGIVPENSLARRFRDLAGWTNQQVAAVCPSVTLVVAGLPLELKRPQGKS